MAQEPVLSASDRPRVEVGAGGSMLADMGTNPYTQFMVDTRVGFEKILASHLCVRAELTAAFGTNDYGVAVALLPAVSVSIPFGRYAVVR
jgi:hypothetical protein